MAGDAREPRAHTADMLIAILAVGSLALCHIDHARYVLRRQPGITAEFRPIESGADWPSKIALVVRFAKSGRTYWFVPWSGGTDDLQHLASTTEVTADGWRPPSPDGGPRPLGDVDYIAMTKTYDVIDAVPRRGGLAPAHLLLPNLGDKTGHANHDAAPKRFFDLVGC